MAASEVYSSLYSTTNVGLPLYNRPHNPGSGTGTDAVSYTIATTSLDDVGDFIHLIPVPSGRSLVALWFNSADLDGGTALVADIVLRTKDKAGNITDTTLFSGSSGFQSAITTDRLVTLANVVVPNAALGYGSIGLKVTTAAGTPASGAINIAALWW